MGYGDVYTITERSWVGYDDVEKNRLCYAVTFGDRGILTYRITSKIKSISDIGNYKVFLTNSGSLYVCLKFKDSAPTMSFGYKRV